MGYRSFSLTAGGFCSGNLGQAIALEQHFIYDRHSSKLHLDLDGNGTVEQVMIITFDGYPALNAKDIYLF